MGVTYTSGGYASGVDDAAGSSLSTGSVLHRAGALLVVIGLGWGTGTISFSGGGLTWRTAGGSVNDGSNGINAIGYAVMGGSDSTFAVTFNTPSSTTYRRIFVLEFASTTGFDSDPLATYATGKTGATGTSQTTNQTAAPSTADNVVVAGFNEWEQHTTYTGAGSPASFTVVSSPGYDYCAQYLIQTSANAANGGANVDSQGTNQYTATCCAFKVASGGSTSILPVIMHHLAEQGIC